MARRATQSAKARPLLTGQPWRTRKPAPADAHLDVKLWLRLLNLTNQIKRLLAARLRREFNTSLARFDLLAQLERASPQGLSMTALSARAMVTNGAITGLVDGLVRDGLASRGGHSDDRRTVIVALTRLGKRSFLSMARRHEGWVRELFDGVPAGRKLEFEQCLAMMKMQLRGVHVAPGSRLTLRGDLH